MRTKLSKKNNIMKEIMVDLIADMERRNPKKAAELNEKIKQVEQI